ncbi:MAG TPA: phosphatidylglycerol lysyltransferase domain-containing protein [Acidimicrobiales bacterium]|nr:phosphatidylglycerol lysyltransferase domain-containing protein [Acidimicrobiales bacterium]
MAPSERLTLPIPYGHHVYVVSDLGLSVSSDPAGRAVIELTELLGDIDDPATVVIAGNLLAPTDRDAVVALTSTLAALEPLVEAIRAFTTNRDHQLIVLPGRDDASLDSVGARRILGALGVRVTGELMLRVATANGVRDLAIAAGRTSIDAERADIAERDDARRLEDPTAMERFVASRVLYRRFAPWVWFPVIAMAIFDLLNTGFEVVSHFTHHDITVKTPHTTSFWGDLTANLLIIVLVEALVVAVAGLIVRRRFVRGTRSSEPPGPFEPLALTYVDDVDALEFARRVAERGGAGAVVGGCPRPALAFLDRGMCAAPGPSGTVVVERRGRLGLPPVFATAERLGVVEIEAASTVQVRLYAGQSPRWRARLLERLLGGAAAQPEPGAATLTIGSWPNGNPFPVSHDRLSAQRRRRSVRRWASGLIFVDGLVNVAVTVSAPLRSRLHTVLNVLPLSVAQSAAALTAVAGVAMIMMARGIRRGQRRAWFLTSLALAVTVVAHLARGGSVTASLVAVSILALLVIERDHFQATSDRANLTVAMARIGLVAAVAVLAGASGIEASGVHRHLPAFGVVLAACAERMVGITAISLATLPDRVGDFINPSLLAVGISLVVTTIYLITRPVVDRRLSEKGTSAERRVAEFRAREIVRRHGRGTLDYFALRDDKQFFFFRDSLVAYAVYGGVALISPDPIGPGAERAESFSAFRSFAESRGWTIGIMGAGAEWLPIYHGAGLHSIYLGDEAIVDCPTFSLSGHKMKSLRQACTRLARHGYTVEFLDPSTIEPSRVPEIVNVISMLRRGEGERGFSMMLGRLFDPKDKGLLLTVVHGPDGCPVAVCQFVPTPALNGYSLDLMRRDPGEHPNGLIDYALCSTIEHVRASGGRGLSLNFAAFRSVLDGERGEGTFTRVERWALKRLSGILPIESLWAFNAKYDPAWLPRYLVYPAAESFVPVVAATLRAESITEIPVLGRFFANDPANRPGTVIPPEILEAAQRPTEEADAHRASRLS